MGIASMLHKLYVQESSLLLHPLHMLPKLVSDITAYFVVMLLSICSMLFTANTSCRQAIKNHLFMDNKFIWNLNMLKFMWNNLLLLELAFTWIQCDRHTWLSHLPLLKFASTIISKHDSSQLVNLSKWLLTSVKKFS